MWRLAHLSDRRLMIILAIPTGFLAGLAAVLIKFLAHTIRDFFFYLRHFERNEVESRNHRHLNVAEQIVSR